MFWQRLQEEYIALSGNKLQVELRNVKFFPKSCGEGQDRAGSLYEAFPTTLGHLRKRKHFLGASWDKEAYHLDKMKGVSSKSTVS